MIVILDSPATKDQLETMRGAFRDYIKVVVDVVQSTLAGGGPLHHDCEQVLLKQGSYQKDLWGGGVDLNTKIIEFNALINTRPGEGNPSQEILDPKIREKFEKIVKDLILAVLE